MSTANNDLPLMANVKEMLVRHYMINLSCQIDRQVFVGQVIVFLDLLSESKSETKCVLDCCDLDVEKVEEIVVQDLNLIYSFGIDDWSRWEKLQRRNLCHQVTEWSLTSHRRDPKVNNDESFPRVLCISYRTKPTGRSITWIKNQNERWCAFTQGAWINNRSLFPCQEPPTAMATWQAWVSTSYPEAIVLMSGDKEPQTYTLSDDEKGNCSFGYYSFTRMCLPMSTLALAIGVWSREIIVSAEIDAIFADHTYSQLKLGSSLISCRLFATDQLLLKAKNTFMSYLPSCLSSAHKILGRHPFSRLDIVILPRCFASLGMASPNLLMVSQSLISGDMRVHLAHEVSHSWFGLSIGALDWTEEWLSEGFATYMEDHVHALAMDWTERESAEWSELRRQLRRQNLETELENTELELQTLRATGTESEGVVYVKNGMNPWKSFTQVHYLKGYFLLDHLSSLVGHDVFLKFLRIYVEKHEGRLVFSREFFQLYFKQFPNIQNITIDSIYHDWLDCPMMPKVVQNVRVSTSNAMWNQIKAEEAKWKLFNRTSLRRKKKKLKLEFNELRSSEQLTLLLEFLLKEPRLLPSTLSALNNHFGLENCNAHVKHRWCELIVKHDYKPGLGTVAQFLEENQAMGVYLYGELLISGLDHQIELAKTCFQQLSPEMDLSSKEVISEMIESDVRVLIFRIQS